MDKKPVFTALFAGSGLSVDTTKLFPGKPITIEKSDGSSKVVHIKDVNCTLTDNPMTGSQEFTLHVSFENP